MKLTIEIEVPDDAPGYMQVELSRQWAVQMLEQIERQWPGFRKRAAREDSGRFWLYVNRQNGRQRLDKLVVEATECRATTHRDQIIELQRALRRIVVAFDDHYPGLYSRLSAMMRDGLPLGILLRRLIGGRPVDGAKAQQTRKTRLATEFASTGN